MTKWARDVSPDKSLPEYPRPADGPQGMAEPQRLWEFTLAKKGEEAPLGKTLDGPNPRAVPRRVWRCPAS